MDTGRVKGIARMKVCGLAAALLLAVAAACASRPPATPAPQSSHPIVRPRYETIAEARTLRDQGRMADFEDALGVLSTSMNGETRRRAIALLGLHLLENKRWADAVPQLEAAIAVYPEVAPFLSLRVAEAEAARGSLARAAAILAELAAGSETTASATARLRLPAIHARLGERDATERTWEEASKLPIDELTEADFVAMATDLDEAGRGDLATKTRMRLLLDYTQGRYTEQTYDFLRGELETLTVEQKASLAGKLSGANRFGQALDLFGRIPGGVATARPTRLRALFSSRAYTRLLAETAGLSLDDPAMLLLRARAAWRSGSPAAFLAGLSEIEKRFPASREALDAKVLRAKYFITDEVDYARAAADLVAVTGEAAFGNDGENLWNLGWVYTLWGKDDEALKTFDRTIRAWPDGDWKTNSLFWSARILDRLGRAEERDAIVRQLVGEFPFSYYSYRARERWGAVDVAPPAAVFPDTDLELAQLGEARIATVRELGEIDLARAAAHEMKAIAAKYPGSKAVQFMLADVYAKGGEPFRANGILQREFRAFVRHGGTGIPRRFWEILFPLAYWDTIRTEAARYEHDPYLIASIIRQESGFEPTTVSNAGAVGLMQIMPEEAPRISAAAGLGRIERAGLFDPKTNIAVGAAELAQKQALMNGNAILAIAAYNAGERAVSQWAEHTPVEDTDLFVESIPYAETRLYVKTVTRNRFEYRRIYEGEENSPLPAPAAQ